MVGSARSLLPTESLEAWQGGYGLIEMTTCAASVDDAGRPLRGYIHRSYLTPFSGSAAVAAGLENPPTPEEVRRAGAF